MPGNVAPVRRRAGVSKRPIEFPVEGISDGEVRLRLPTDADDPGDHRRLPRPRHPALDTGSGVLRRVRPRRSGRQSRGANAKPARASTSWLPTSTAMSSSGRSACGSRPGEGRCDLGYWLAPRARGRGVTTRAVLLLSALGVRQPPGGEDRDHDRAGECGVPRRRGARRLHVRGRASLAHRDQGNPPRHGDVLPPAGRLAMSRNLDRH